MSTYKVLKIIVKFHLLHWANLSKSINFSLEIIRRPMVKQIRLTLEAELGDDNLSVWDIYLQYQTYRLSESKTWRKQRDWYWFNFLHH